MLKGDKAQNTAQTTVKALVSCERIDIFVIKPISVACWPPFPQEKKQSPLYVLLN